MIGSILLHPFFILPSIFISVTIFVYYAWKVLKTPYGKYEERYLEVASGKLDQMYLFLPPQTILYLKFICSFIGFIFLALLFSSVQFAIIRIIMTFFGGILGFILPELILKFMWIQRMNRFEIQMVEVLTGMSNSLKAGFSLPQAIELVVKEGQPPISQELNLVLKENRLGVSLEDALVSMTKRVESEDLDLVVSSIVLTRELGGNLANIFERLAHTIRERMKLKGKIKSLTSQGIMQGVVVGALPLFMGGVLFIINPKMMDMFYTHIAGWICTISVIILEILGAYSIKKIVTIDV